MKLGYGCLIFLLACSASAKSQDSSRRQFQHDQHQDQQQQQQQQQRPTLGPPPSLYGARASNTTDPRRLMRIRTIFVERVDYFLGEKIAAGLTRIGRFRVVSKRDEADAIMRGTCFDSRRLKSVHTEMYITDRGSGGAIWQDSVRKPFNPPPLDKAIDDTAFDILAHLEESIKQAERRQ